MKSKSDSILGKEISKLLFDKGVETPMKTPTSEASVIIEEAFDNIMNALGLDLTDDSLSETPKRVSKMFSQELFWGLDYNNFPRVMTIDNKMSYDSMVLERNIKVHSMCEHHFVPIIGKAFVAYVPNSKVIGLSKINRIVDFFCRRPQVQERLCEQIYYTLSHLLGTDDVAVLIQADHMCVKLRGVEDSNSDTVTAKLGGSFVNGNLRNEFYQLVKM